LHEGDGGSAREGNAAMLEDGFERLKEIVWYCSETPDSEPRNTGQ
jgi:hypothetical protein